MAYNIHYIYKLQNILGQIIVISVCKNYPVSESILWLGSFVTSLTKKVQDRYGLC